MSVNFEKKYSIFVKNFFWKKEILINIIYINPNKNKIDQKSDKYFLEKFESLNIDADKINEIYFYKFKAFPYIDTWNINIYNYRYKEQDLKLMEIADICIDSKYQSRGIGSQIMSILEKIAIENKINYIVGELEEDRDGEPLENRKRFFIKNGFILEKSNLPKFSGVVAKKKIGDIIQL